MQEKKQSIKSIKIEWLETGRTNIFKDIEMTLFYVDNPDIPIFIGKDFIQIYHTDLWHNYFENKDYKLIEIYKGKD